MSQHRDDPYDLVGTAELAHALNVDRTRASVLSKEKGFPDPVVDRERIRLWHRQDAEEWLDRHRPGWRVNGWPERDR